MSNARDLLLDAQTSVLGCMVIDSNTVGPILQTVRASDFTEPTYRMIFEAIRAMFNAGEPIDAVTINEKLGGRQTDLLTQLITITPSAANYAEYARLLKKRARLYALRSLGEQISLAEDEESVRRALDRANELLVDRPDVRCVGMEQALKDFYDRHAETVKPEFLDWRFGGVNGVLNIHGGDFVVIGGYPSDGKTTLALTFAQRQAQKKRVGFFSYETDDAKLFDRLIAFTTQIGLPKMQLNAMGAHDWDTLAAMSTDIIKPKLDLIMANGMTVSDIRAYAASKRYEVVFVDYLQKITAPEGMRDAYNEFVRVTAVSSMLQNLAKQTGMTIVALSQLSRREKGKGNARPKPPTMQDLRSSGQIEQDADAIMLLFREDPLAEKSKRVLNIVKNKDGIANRAVLLEFDGATQTFRQSQALPREPKKPREPEPEQLGFKLLPGHETPEVFREK